MIAATTITIIVSRVVSWRVGHVTLLNSEITSPKILRLNARRVVVDESFLGAVGFLAISGYRTSL